MQRAGEVDLGFDQQVLSTMMLTIDRFKDDELPLPPRWPLRYDSSFRDWANELAS